MKTRHSLPSSVLFRVLLAVFLAFTVACPVRADEYGFEKKDRLAGEAKYLSRLAEDRKKVELAILNTKALIHKARNKPYLPELYMRLAELYIEQSRIVYYVRRTERREAASAFDQMESNALKNQALEIYQRILNDFPSFGARDKVHFFMAHEYRELNQIDDMVVQYRTIIQKYPDSIYVPESYLLLGDYFISRQDLDTAKKHYEAVLRYPGSSAVSIARYKLGWCHINQLQFAEALALFQEVVTGVEKGKDLEIDTYKRVDIKQEALMDMAYCYTEAHRDNPPEEALAYFQKYSWSRQVYASVLEKLANRYYIKKKWAHAAVVYRKLSSLEQEPVKLLEYARNTFECVQALGTFEHADQDVVLIVKALRKEKYSAFCPDEVKAKDQADFELYARNIITYLHEHARGNDSADEFRRAAEAYKVYLDFFEDSPAYADMAENYAEALFSSHQYLKAGRQYETLALRMDKADPGRQEKLSAAVTSYYHAIRNREHLTYFETAYAREGLKSAGRLFAESYPGSPRVPDVRFNVAWVAYDAGDYDGAIAEFTRFVQDYPDGEASKAAVHMILDAYSLKEDYPGLIAFGNGVIRNAGITDQQLKAEVAGIVQSTENKVISSLTVAALDDWEKGKEDLISYASQTPTSGMGEQALAAVVLSSKEKGDIRTLLTTGADLVRQYPTSPKVEGTLNAMIDGSLRMAQFRLTADYLESFSLRLPDHKNAKDFLLQAARIRAGLGQHDLAAKDYRQLLSMRSVNGAMMNEAVFGASDSLLARGETGASIEVLTEHRDRLGEAGRIRAEARTAALLIESGEAGRAEASLKRVEKSPARKISDTDPAAARDLARMTYASTSLQLREYMELKLSGQIDNDVVARKTALLERLEKGYQEVMLSRSPEWALKACYQASSINREFARFLEEAPIPAELSPEEQEQYAQIIEEKAQAYRDKADQYLQTAVQQGRKWEICDPGLAWYCNHAAEPGSAPARVATFAGTSASAEIGGQCLLDQELKAIHERLLKEKPDQGTLLDLCTAYMQRGDYRHATLIALKALDEKSGASPDVTADLQNALGVSRLHLGEDCLARDAFRGAISALPTHVGARVNLAALLTHYGHTVQAQEIYAGLPALSEIEKTEDVIHPRAKELYHASIQISKK